MRYTKSMHKLANNRNHIKQMRENKTKNTRKTETCLHEDLRKR